MMMHDGPNDGNDGTRSYDATWYGYGYGPYDDDERPNGCNEYGHGYDDE